MKRYQKRLCIIFFFFWNVFSTLAENLINFLEKALHILWNFIFNSKIFYFRKIYSFNKHTIFTYIFVFKQSLSDKIAKHCCRMLYRIKEIYLIETWSKYILYFLEYNCYSDFIHYISYTSVTFENNNVIMEF